MSSWQPSCRRSESWDCRQSKISSPYATSGQRGAAADLQVGIVHLRSHATPAALDKLVEVLRQARDARVGISPPFHELAETSDALRFARLAVTGKPLADSLVAVFDDTPLRSRR